ncbi:GyrI-like domain-containing protein [Paenibacillus tarimensis]
MRKDEVKMIQLNEPKVEYREEKPCVYIPIRVPMKEWNKTTVLIGEVLAWIGRKGLESGGAPFYRYREIGDMEKAFSLEVGAPVTQPVEGDGKVLGGTIPSGKYVTLMHNGHPDSLVYSLRHTIYSDPAPEPDRLNRIQNVLPTLPFLRPSYYPTPSHDPSPSSRGGRVRWIGLNE